MERKLFLMRSFGHIADEYFSVGINGKNSEFHAAMGLAVLPYLEKIIQSRKKICCLYTEKLKHTSIKFINFSDGKI
jgi:dTDP-4-amino-4,6-dideoxygalactose transaminase